jgi:hypothetical protein
MPLSIDFQYKIVMMINIAELDVVLNFWYEPLQLQICSHDCRQCHSSVQNIFIRERGAVSKVNAYG